MFWIFRLDLLLINSFCLRQNGFVYSMIHLILAVISFTARESVSGKSWRGDSSFCCGAAAFFVEKPWEKPWEKTKSWTQPRRKILMRAYKTFCRSAHANIILHEDSGRNPGNEQTSASPLLPKWTENHPDRRWQFTRIHHFHVICGDPAAVYFPMC